MQVTHFFQLWTVTGWYINLDFQSIAWQDFHGFRGFLLLYIVDGDFVPGGFHVKSLIVNGFDILTTAELVKDGSPLTVADSEEQWTAET